MQIKDKEGKVIFEGELTEQELEKAILAQKTTEQQKVSMTEELIGLRKANAILKEERDADEKKNKEVPPNPTDPEVLAQKAVELIMDKKDKESAELNHKTACERFKNTHKELHPDTDIGGVKWSLLESKFRRFDTSGLKSVEDFTSALNDAYALLRRMDSQDDDFINPFSSTPSENANPRTVDSSGLSFKELKLIKDSFAGDKARYLKIKSKRPEYVDSLLKYL